MLQGIPRRFGQIDGIGLHSRGGKGRKLFRQGDLDTISRHLCEGGLRSLL
jgi:hypothetical protein